MSSSIIDMAIAVLRETEDGEKLAPVDLALVEYAVNGALNEAGEVAFYDLHDRAIGQVYRKPWFHGIEGLTKDHEGYVYWKGQQVEHFSFNHWGDGDWREREKAAAEETAEACRQLEAYDIPVNTTNAVWRYPEVLAGRCYE